MVYIHVIQKGHKATQSVMDRVIFYKKRLALVINYEVNNTKHLFKCDKRHSNEFKPALMRFVVLV